MDFNDFQFGDSEFAASSSQQPQDDVFVLSEQDRNRYKNLFESMDTDHDGYLSQEEVANYVSQNSLPADSLDEVFALCDVDQDGFLSLPEFTSAAHIFYLHQTGVPIPSTLPSALTDLPAAESETPTNDFMFDFEALDSTSQPNPISSTALQSSLNLDLIPTPRMDDLFSDETPEEGGNPFSASAAQYIEDHRAEEEELLNSLKDAVNVPAVVCENREKLAQLWQANMRQWRERELSLRETEKEVREQKRANEQLRKEIKDAEKKLRELQDSTELQLKRIVKRQGKLNNALVDNQLDYPIRAEFDDIDITDLFSPPDPAPKLSVPKSLTAKTAMQSVAPVSYDVLDQDASLDAPSTVNLFTSPMEEIDGSKARARGDLNAPPTITFKAFQRSRKARSFAPAGADAGASAIGDSEESDEDLKPAKQSEFAAFSRKKAEAEADVMGSKRWYRGVYAKHQQQLEEDERREQELEEEMERMRQELEEKEIQARRDRVREREERRKARLRMMESSSEESESSSSDSEEDLPVEKEVFVMSDTDDEVFSDDDLPVEREPADAPVPVPAADAAAVPPVAESLEGPAGETAEPPVMTDPELAPEIDPELVPEIDPELVPDTVEIPAEKPAEKPADEAAEKPEEIPVEAPAGMSVGDGASEAAEDKKGAKKDKKDKKKDKKDKKEKKGKKEEEKKPATEVADDDFEEDLPMEKPESKPEPKEKDKDKDKDEGFSDDDLPAEKAEGAASEDEDLPAEKAEKTPKKSPKTPKTPKKDDKDDKAKKGRKGRKENKNGGGGGLMDLGPVKKHTKKKAPAKK